MQQQISEVGRWIGSVFYGVLGSVLPYINGFVMAIKELIRTFALFLGYEIPDSSGSTGTILDQMEDSMGGISDGVGDVNNGLGDTNKKLKEAIGQLASFDKLNVIQKPTSNADSGSGSSGGGLSVDPRLLQALKDYDYLFGNIRMKATEIKEQLLGWADTIGRFLDINIFEPFQLSWIKYGGSVIASIFESKEDIAHIFGGVFDVVGDKWRPFFQQATDLFFGLLDTGALVTSTITTFWRSVWDNGGKYLFESIWDLGTAFLKLANSVNDNFVKPLITWLKNNIAPTVGWLVGVVMKGVGDTLKTFANLMNGLAENKAMVILLGSAFTAMFATIKIAKFVELTSMMTGTHKVLKALGTLALEHSSTLRKLWIAFADGNGVLSKLKTSFTSANNVLKKVFTTGAVSMNVFGETMKDTGTKAGVLAGKITSGLGTALSWLATNPLVAVAVGIGLLITGIVLYQATADDGANRTKELAKEIADLTKKTNESKREIVDLGKKTKESLADASVEYSATENYLKKLVDLTGGKNGYVENIGEAKLLVDKLNEVCADSASITEDGYVIWLKTPEAIQQNIDKMKELLKLQVYEEQYVEALKQEKELKKQNAEAVRKQTEAQKMFNDEVDRLIKANPGMTYQEASYRTAELRTNLLNANEALNTSTFNLANNKHQMGELGLQIQETNGTLEQQAIAQAELSLVMDTAKGNHGELTASYASLGEALMSYDSQLANHTSGVKTMTDEELLQATISRDYIIQSCIEKASAHGQSFESMMKDLTSYGVEMSAEEKRQLQDSYNNYVDNGTDIETIKNQQYERLKASFQKLGIDITEKQLRQIVNEQANLRKNNQEVQTLKSQQYQQLLILLDKYGIDVDSKDGKSYKKKLQDSNEYGTKSGSNYVEKMADELSDKYGKTTEATKKTIDKVSKQADKANPKITVTADTSSASNALSKLTESRKTKLYVTPELTRNGIQVGKSRIGFEMYANGGFPNVGQMFIAREAGVEMVGTMGGRPAVANNDQIVSGIESGVFRAVYEAFKMIGGFKTPDVYTTNNIVLDKKVVQSQMSKADEEHQAKTGKRLFKKGGS
ncbi:hypothetical protein ACWG0P_14095 [Amedibacillus sp. YH-ame6]